MSENPRNLWAPWRLDYLQQLTAGGQAMPGKSPPAGCFLCDAADPDPREQTPSADAERLVLHRTGHNTLLLNRYPYTNGHLLAAPYAHVGELSDLSSEARADLMELAELGCRLLKETIHPQGFNVGLNLGRAAGAGVPGHLHLHVVPRWAGDTNFIDVVGGTRVIPQALEASYTMLRRAVEAMVQ